MEINENALEYLVDDMINLNLNDDFSNTKIENDNVSAIYSQNSFSSEEKSIISKDDDIEIEDDLLSDIGSNSNSGSEPSVKIKKIVDTPKERSKILVKINNRIKRGYTTKVKCTINTPLDILNEELLYQDQFIKNEQSIELYKAGINNAVRAIEWIAGMSPLENFDVNLNGLGDAWGQEENQLALDSIVEELEIKYGSMEMSPELKLGFSLFKTIFVVVQMNRSGVKPDPLKKPKAKPKKNTVLKSPSAAIRKKVNKK